MRAPVQVTAKAVKSNALARSMMIRSGTAPYIEKADRDKPHHMGEAPPADGAQRHVLRPHEKQQQAKNSLDINCHQKQGVDVERHGLITSLPGPVFGISPRCHIAYGGKRTDECAYSDTAIAPLWFRRHCQSQCNCPEPSS